MNDRWTYGLMNGDSVHMDVARLLHHAFAGPVDGCLEWMRGAGFENFRVVTDDGRTLGCLLRIPMGQFFGGRSVPMVGIAGVAVAPEARGAGVARWMMARAMRELRAEGVALSGLYASTQALYRQVGFEQAGHRSLITIPLATVGCRERAGEVRPLTDADEPARRACYRDFAARFNGLLDRGDYLWTRTRKNRETAYTGFGVFVGDAIEGYAFVHQSRKDSGRHNLVLSDLAYTTPAAGRRLLGFLSDFQTMADDLRFYAGPAHPLLTLMPLQKYAVERFEYWMTRLVDVRAALQARGYAPGVEASARFEITDESCPDNAGLWTLAVRRGAGRLDRGGSSGPLIRADIRGLAMLYTGFMSPHEAGLAGLLDATPPDLDAITPIFAGPTPWMTDMF